ncbi:predicted protein [Plenodomus lingam JN3]|uniref:Predicted protein n=1 Tax=Leptosphaeria maculans (strain JN3 / isolate v23.1.3 / race Av1-4-5-6-7-8) TaxID=985895 RepID=E5A9E8_LEPMJ|nr:predicted protein [Plenodomus lingam JN3]CBY00289.1 predicted protein [Plenodomus lingam JN3]
MNPSLPLPPLYGIDIPYVFECCHYFLIDMDYALNIPSSMTHSIAFEAELSS